MTPTYEEWLATDFVKLVLLDIYDTFVQGGKGRADFYFYEIPSEGKEQHYRSKALTHLCAAHEFAEGPDSYDLSESNGNVPTSKRHMANSLSRLFVARGHQVMRDNGISMKQPEEVIEG